MVGGIPTPLKHISQLRWLFGKNMFKTSNQFCFTGGQAYFRKPPNMMECNWGFPWYSRFPSLEISIYYLRNVYMCTTYNTGQDKSIKSVWMRSLQKITDITSKFLNCHFHIFTAIPDFGEATAIPDRTHCDSWRYPVPQSKKSQRNIPVHHLTIWLYHWYLPRLLVYL